MLVERPACAIAGGHLGRYGVSVALVGGDVIVSPWILGARPCRPCASRKLVTTPTIAAGRGKVIPDSSDYPCGSIWRTSSRPRPRASISASTPYSADSSSQPVSTVCASSVASSPGTQDSAMAPRCPSTRIVWAGAESMTSWSRAGR